MTKEAQRRVTESIEEFLTEIRLKHFNFMEPLCLEECHKYQSINEEDFKRYLETKNYKPTYLNFSPIKHL